MQASSNDAALALIQSGQVDWTHNFVPNVEKAYESKDPKHYHAFYANRDYPISLVFDDTQYPYSLSAVPQGRQPRDRPQDRVGSSASTATRPPTDAIGLNGLFPKWVTDKSVKALAKSMASVQPDRGEEDADRRRLHVQGQPAARPEGQLASSSTST